MSNKNTPRSPATSLSNLFSDRVIPHDDLQTLKVLGSGQFGTVELALHKKSGTKMAVKRLKSGTVEDKVKDLFIKECEVLRSLRHGNIVGFLGVGFSDTSDEAAERSSLFLAQEYLPGGSLRSVVLEQMMAPHRTVYSYASAWRWLVQIAQGLDYLHRSMPMVIHRDLKLENIMVDDARAPHLLQTVKLVDFGLASLIDRESLSLRRRATQEREAMRSSGRLNAGSIIAVTGNGSAVAVTPGAGSGGSPPRTPAVYAAAPDGPPDLTSPTSTLAVVADGGVTNDVRTPAVAPSAASSSIAATDAATDAELDRLVLTSRTAARQQRASSFGQRASSFGSASIASSPSVAASPRLIKAPGFELPPLQVDCLDVAVSSLPGGGGSVGGDGSPSSPTSPSSPNKRFELTGRTGSLTYMAPEVYNDEKYNEKADVFSFAIIAYELLHKTVMAITVASQGLQSQVEMYAYRVSQGYRPPLGDHLPPGLARLLRDCWAQSPADRPRMSKVVARLKEVQADALKMDGDDGLTANGGLANCRCTIS